MYGRCVSDDPRGRSLVTVERREDKLVCCYLPEGAATILGYPARTGCSVGVGDTVVCRTRGPDLWCRRQQPEDIGESVTYYSNVYRCPSRHWYQKIVVKRSTGTNLPFWVS